MRLSYTHTVAGELTLDTETLPQAALDYLLQYGFSQSLQDSIAGRAKAVREEVLKDNPEASEADIKEAVDNELTGALLKRLDAIKAGEVATRGSGTPRDPAAGIVREMLQAIAKKQGKKLPKADSPEYAAMAAKVRAAKATEIAAELERRRNAVDDLDIEI